jgi:hypothetical protein
MFPEPEDEDAYVPQEPDAAELAAIKADMRTKQVQITPDNIRHALETAEIRRLLSAFGVNPDRKVSATRDCKGMVRMNFDEFRRCSNALRRGVGS